MVANELQGIQIYELKLEMLEVEPLIWRRLLVPGSITLAQLHEVIQTAMGWTNSHLHSLLLESTVTQIRSSRLMRPGVNIVIVWPS